MRRTGWYWILQGAGWSAVALFNLSLSMGTGGWRAAVVSVWGALAGLLVSDLWHRLLKRHPAFRGGARWPYVAAGIVACAAAETVLVYAAFLVFQPFGAPHGVAWLPYALMFWIGQFFAWTVCYQAALSMRRARHAEATALRLELHAKDVELRALQAQVNPHFFFNSLNSVRALIYEDPEAAAQMIDQLAALMRYALQSGHADTVPLSAELEAVQAYLAIERIRFEDRLRVQVDVEGGLERVPVPPMALQTLVENAVKYGVEQSATGSDIRIRACRDGNAIRVEVANIGAIRRYPNATQVGLANARKRLALALGGQSSLELGESDGWVRATLLLPAMA
ncbi:histidine kinase [Pseudoduganella lurida]|uniref:Histidine kinase n=2 Tax=Pseudoduganella lurida TaxID=1036180 RepID=A0A562R7Q1_9BURK|nr:histidine kinase [Pseudoduganella lurida]